MSARAAALALALVVMVAARPAGAQAAAPQPPAANDAAVALGKRLFTTEAAPPCAVCHTLKDAGSAGIVGPVLDELRPDAARVMRALRTGIGVMPAYGERLTEAQLEALAAYVSRAAASGP